MKQYALRLMYLLAIVPISTLFAQDNEKSEHYNLKLAFEFGTNEAGCKFVGHERIRKDNKAFNELFSNRRYSLVTTYFGVKPEFFIMNNRLGFASGLRFTTAKSELVAGMESFLWKAKEDGINTSYYRLNKVSQKSYLFSVPFEMRYFLNNRELPFQTYVKIGASLNYRINSVNYVDFVNATIEMHKDLVKNQLSDKAGYESDFSSFVFAAFGFKIGKFKEGSRVPWVNFELKLPYILLTEKSFNFVDRYNGNGFPGIGIQLSFQIPIGHNMPIGLN